MTTHTERQAIAAAIGKSVSEIRWIDGQAVLNSMDWRREND